MKVKVAVGFATLVIGILFGILVQPFARANQLDKTPVQNVKVGTKYSMNIPDYLKPDSSLNSEATLQYSNYEKEVYIIVIDESRQEFIDIFLELGEYDTTKTPLENYAKAQMESIIGNLDTTLYTSPVRKANLRNSKMNTENALIYDVGGTQSGIEGCMSFTVAFVEGKYNLYMIMTWTLTDRWDLYKDDMNNMVLSFREL